MTNEKLAAALGVSVRCVERYRKRGLTPPSADESIEAWTQRAQDWRKQTRRRSGPKPSGDDATKAEQAKWDARFRKARAMEKEHVVALLEGRVHDVQECEERQVQRMLELRNRLTLLPDKMAQVLVNVSDPEFIRSTIASELQRALEDLGRTEVAADGLDAEEAEEAEDEEGEGGAG